MTDVNAIIIALLLPFVGTTAGAACIFFMRHGVGSQIRKLMLGFAAGVMVAASVWSLIIPSMEMTGASGFMSVMPAAVGVIAGMLFLLLLDCVTPHQHLLENEAEGPASRLRRSTKMMLAVTLHNIPEGMAVGVALAAVIEGGGLMTVSAAIALSVGIAIQNFPEGAIVAMPLRDAGVSRGKAFLLGTLSGAVEPVAAVATLLLTSLIAGALPYLLAFAAGAMLYVVVEEIVPETQQGRHSDFGTVGFAAGFVLMMVLDVVFA